jgi:RNA-directed DNA polymerase
VNWILDADIRSFFDGSTSQWLVRFLEHRIGDERIMRLVRKWLKAGVLEDGAWSVSETGTPQGAVAHRCLPTSTCTTSSTSGPSNGARREATGKMIVVRYADDRWLASSTKPMRGGSGIAMRERFERFGARAARGQDALAGVRSLRGIERRQRRGQGRPETFRFLGFTFICGRKRNGGFQLQRRTRGDRMRNRLQEIKAELRRHMHSPLVEQGTWLAQVLRGYYAYHAVPTNLRSLAQFRYRVAATWRRLLSRRSQKSRVNWERMTQIADEWLPQPRVLHPWPDQRFAVKHPRWEPNA